MEKFLIWDIQKCLLRIFGLFRIANHLNIFFLRAFMFCPKCGDMLKIKKKDGKNAFYCEECKIFVSQEGKIKDKGKEAKEVSVSSDDGGEIHPVTNDAECPKCKHNKAYYWFVQMRAADEAPTRFYKCTKCKYTWREYD